MSKRRIFYKQSYFHVLNRGCLKSDIFMDYHDYVHFIGQLSYYSKMFDIKVISYCLMPNHFHLLLKNANRAKAIPKMMQRLQISVAMHKNSKYFTSGHVFQNRYKSKHINTLEYRLFLSRYIHNNPLELGYVDYHGEYPWSSYLDYKDNKNRFHLGVKADNILKYFDNFKEYREFCLISDKKAKIWAKRLTMSSDLI